MPTLLVNSKMGPGLAARVRASVCGTTAAFRVVRGRARARRWASVLRFGVVLAAMAIVCVGSSVRRRARVRLERDRVDLVEEERRRETGFVPPDRARIAGVEAWVDRLAKRYEGDLIAPELRVSGAIGALRQRPGIYLHAPVTAFAGSGSIAAAAKTSFKDALLLCLLDPPSSRTEGALLGRVLVAYRGGWPVEQATSQVRLLEEAEAALPVLAGPWQRDVRNAQSVPELDALKQALRKAPVERGVKAAEAEVLVVALDEPGLGGPTELDGERAHDVRLSIVDLVKSEVLLRTRRHVDPAWISASRRNQYATGLDECATAFDVLASTAVAGSATGARW